MRNLLLHILLGVVLGVAGMGLFVSLHRGTPAGPVGALTGPWPAERALDETIPDVRLDAVPFDQAVEAVRGLTHVEIVVDWAALAKASVDRRTPVTIHGRGVTLERLLRRLLDAGSAGGKWLAFTPDGEQILISTADDLARRSRVFVRTYDVADLIRWKGVENMDVPEVVEVPFIPFGPPTSASVEEQRAEVLAATIRENIASETWHDSGGQIGTIRYFAGKLVVGQTWENHRRIAELLRVIREWHGRVPVAVAEHQWHAIRTDWSIPEPPEPLDALLRWPLAKVRLKAVPFEPAIEAMRKLSGVNIFVDWEALDAAHFDRQAPVTVDLHDVTLPQVLSVLLGQPLGGAELGFFVDDGVVMISTRDVADRNLCTRVYDVRDLLSAAESTSLPAEAIDDLSKLIVDVVAPDSWRDMGGMIGSIRAFDGRFVITQTWANHEQIARALATIRAHGLIVRPITAPASRPASR